MADPAPPIGPTGFVGRDRELAALAGAPGAGQLGTGRFGV
jgi:hypothetical protein